MIGLYAKIVAALAIVGALVAGYVYIERLQSTIEFQKAALVSAKGIIEEQKTTITKMTEDMKAFEARLEAANKINADIKTQTRKRLETSPPVPEDCKPQVQWLKKRAISLKQDKK